MGQYIKESVKRKIRLLCARKNDTGLCKKYEPYILKYMARILKYMPYIFRHFKLLINNNLQKQSKTL